MIDLQATDEGEGTQPADAGAPPLVSTFLRYLLSSLLGLTAITTATLVDGFFVGRFVGPDGLAAITLLVPFFSVLFSLALMLAIGGSVRCGFLLGKGQPGAASGVFSRTLVASAGVISVLAVLAALGRHTLFSWLGAEEALYPMMSAYLLVMVPGLILQTSIMVFYYFVRVDGHPALASSSLVAGACLNILLDGLFVGVWGGGIEGAALATVVAQVGQGALLCRYFKRADRRLKLVWPDRRWMELKPVVVNGFSEFLNEMSAGVVLLLINWLVIQQAGIGGVAGYTLINYSIFVSVMLAYGVADALHPLVSHSHGAGNVKRIRHLLLLALIVVQAIGWLLVGGLLIAGEQWVALMLGDDARNVLPDVMAMLAVIWPLFLMNTTNVVFSCYLTAVQRYRASLLLSLSRSLVLPALSLLLVYQALPERPVVLALPLAEGVALVLALALVWRNRPHRLRQSQQ